MGSPNIVPTFNFSVPQGTDYSLVLQFKNSDDTNQDLTGFTFRCDAKKKYGEEAIFSPVLTVRDQAISGNVGFVDFLISKEMTIPMSNKEADLVYDIEEVNSSGKVRRRIQGVITIYPESTTNE